MARRKSLIPGFSVKRAVGITSAKQKVARATGIPTTRQGRRRKVEHNSFQFLIIIILILLFIILTK